MHKSEEEIRRKFKRLAAAAVPKTNMYKRCFNAFIIGGFICVIGQFFYNYLLNRGISKEDVGNWIGCL